MATAKEGDLVLVEWRDSSDWSGWRDKEEARDYSDEPVVTCKTAGWITRRTARALILHSSECAGTKQVTDLTKIPRECVVSVTLLGQPAKRKKIRN